MLFNLIPKEHPVWQYFPSLFLIIKNDHTTSPTGIHIQANMIGITLLVGIYCVALILQLIDVQDSTTFTFNHHCHMSKTRITKAHCHPNDQTSQKTSPFPQKGKEKVGKKFQL